MATTKKAERLSAQPIINLDALTDTEITTLQEQIKARADRIKKEAEEKSKKAQEERVKATNARLAEIKVQLDSLFSEVESLINETGRDDGVYFSYRVNDVEFEISSYNKYWESSTY
jgi:hypothetical protein